MNTGYFCSICAKELSEYEIFMSGNLCGKHYKWPIEYSMKVYVYNRNPGHWRIVESKDLSELEFETLMNKQDDFSGKPMFLVEIFKNNIRVSKFYHNNKNPLK